MKSKRLALVLLLGGLAVLLTGCEWIRWLRLLSLKKQFAQLDRYIRVEDTNGLGLHFLKPVVYGDDLRLLVENETSRTTNGNHETWSWTYEKQSLDPHTPRGNFDLTVTAHFENGKFNEVRFPDRFLAVLPKPLILGLLRSVGQAEVDMKHGTAKLKWAGTGKEKLELPAKSQVLALLGPPFTVTESNLVQTFLYKYYQETRAPQAPAERLAWARFIFATNSETMLSSQGGFGNVAWTMTSAATGAQMRITVELVPLSVEPVAVKLPARITDEYIGQYKEPGGNVLNIGRDGGTFAASWNRDGKGSWCLMLPESTNVLFQLPTGEPRWTFTRDQTGAVTGLLGRLGGSDKVFTKVALELPQTAAAALVDAEICQACAGIYKASWGGLIIISRQDRQFFWQSAGTEAKLPLYPSSETNFFFKAVDSPLTFVKNDKGSVTRFILHYCSHSATAEKLKTPSRSE
ncbi:MAG TPA: hypothetical protein VN578_09595 [Candidatus Binatia bacterium]|jgi:hypothetical protein|nr:hypothetical protein [Candidatus Binatia bacterium]